MTRKDDLADDRDQGGLPIHHREHGSNVYGYFISLEILSWLGHTSS